MARSRAKKKVHLNRKKVGFLVLLGGISLFVLGISQLWQYVGVSHPTIVSITPSSFIFHNNSKLNSTLIIQDPVGREGLVNLKFMCGQTPFGNSNVYVNGKYPAYSFQLQMNYSPFKQTSILQGYNCTITASSIYNKTYNSTVPFNIILLPLSNSSTR